MNRFFLFGTHIAGREMLHVSLSSAVYSIPRWTTQSSYSNPLFSVSCLSFRILTLEKASSSSRLADTKAKARPPKKNEMRPRPLQTRPPRLRRYVRKRQIRCACTRARAVKNTKREISRKVDPLTPPITNNEKQMYGRPFLFLYAASRLCGLRLRSVDWVGWAWQWASRFMHTPN